ncbi:hypothetical protein D7X33_10480 [Butyricicoccus sp. 1XD8-22]|nr:hypothetical protein D7X33_10480 [Butyricicoccus sp. 1XD8-22]
MSAGTPREKPHTAAAKRRSGSRTGEGGNAAFCCPSGGGRLDGKRGLPRRTRALLGGANLPSGAEKSRVRAATRGALCIFYSFLTDSLALLLGISLRFPDK